MSETTVRRLVVREPETAEAMLVTADNHLGVAAWIQTKGDGWNIQVPSWGEPGLSVWLDGDSRVFVSDGDYLIWKPSIGCFYSCRPALLSKIYRDRCGELTAS